jgi:Restriction endonuclease AspBHI N-terminal/Restriction endonuclease
MIDIPVRRYRLGHDYRDTGAVNNPADQFLGWINLPGSGMRNMGGIRALRFVDVSEAAPAAIVLVTDERSAGSASNPWDDLVDIPHGRIVYWGDAKFDPKRTVDDFPGNRALRDAFNHVLDSQVPTVPPILHFSKRITGMLRFNGLCVLDRLELTWFEDHGRPVRNYRAHLTILDEEFVDVTWLHSRMTASSKGQLGGVGPRAWRRYQDGVIDRLRVWAPLIRTASSQLPTAGSADASLLSQLVNLTPTGFEAAVVSIFRELDEVRHNITRTRPTGDGGFDFVGSFTLPPPIQYEIPFLGEAKRYARTTAVGPKDVSRLVARLTRGQYGIFVTTSYFTKQTQEEVLEDRYPTTLVAGADLVRIMREMRIARGSEISASWLRSVQDELEGTPEAVLRAAETPATYET